MRNGLQKKVTSSGCGLSRRLMLARRERQRGPRPKPRGQALFPNRTCRPASYRDATPMVTPLGYTPKGPKTGRHRGALPPQAPGNVCRCWLPEASRGWPRALHVRRDARSESPPRSLFSRAAQRCCAEQPSRASEASRPPRADRARRLPKWSSASAVARPCCRRCGWPGGRHAPDATASLPATAREVPPAQGRPPQGLPALRRQWARDLRTNARSPARSSRGFPSAQGTLRQSRSIRADRKLLDGLGRAQVARGVRWVGSGWRSADQAQQHSGS